MRFLMTMLLAAALLEATTLEKLSLDEMVAKSTAIARGRISRSGVRQHGAIFYSHYTLHVTEQYKGAPVRQIDVVLPGGAIGTTQQTFSGVPALPADAEVVLFLWTSKSGLTHVIGLSQGILQVSKDAAGQTVFSREAILEGMVEGRTGRAATDNGMRFTANEFAMRVKSGVRQ